MIPEPSTRKRPKPGPRPAPPESAATQVEVRLPRSARHDQRRKQRRITWPLAFVTVVVAALASLTVVLIAHRGGHPAAAGSPSNTAAARPKADGPAAFLAPDVVTAVLSATTTAVETVDSYDYRHLSTALAAGAKVTTGAFGLSYRQAMTGTVAAAAPAAKTVQLCTVQKAGISSVSTDGSQSTAVVFGRLQTEDTTTGSTPRQTAVILGVTLQKAGGVWLISAMTDLSSADAPTAEVPGTPGLAAAVQAAGTEVVDLLSYRRADFDADFARAVGGLSGTLAQQQQSHKAAILAAMTAGRYDLAGHLRAVGVEAASGDTVLLLVAATGYQVDGSGTRTQSTAGRFEIGLTEVDDSWLVSQFTQVGLI